MEASRGVPPGETPVDFGSTLNMCGGRVTVEWPFSFLHAKMDIPYPDEIWLVKDGRVVGKITNIGEYNVPV